MDSIGAIGTLVIEPGDTTITYIPQTNFNGTDIFSYMVQDYYGGISTATVIINVLPINDPPIISGLPDSTEFVEDNFSVLNMWDFVADIETPDSLLIYQFNASDGLILYSYDRSNGELTIYAVDKFTGQGSIFITIRDNSGATASDSLIVLVNPIASIKAEQEYNHPKKFVLSQNHPNPFNPSTVISWQLAKDSHVELNVYNLLGQKVATLVSERQRAGSYQVEWDAAHLSSGIYFYKIQAGEWQDVKRITLVR